jgi:hypothetical protein
MNKKFGWAFVVAWFGMVLLQLTWIGLFVWAVVHFVRKFW